MDSINKDIKYNENLFTFFDNDDTISIGDDTPTVDDLKEDGIMCSRFANTDVINVYIVCEDGEKFINNKQLLLNVALYESKNVAKASRKIKELVAGSDLLEIQLSLVNCLDLLDFGDVNILQQAYDFAHRKKLFSSRDIGRKIVPYCMSKSNKNVVRDLVITKKDGKPKPLFKGSTSNQCYIIYRAFDVNCIGQVKIIETYT